MKLLEERIIRDGIIAPGNVLRVDSFLNHQIDVPFICELGREFYRLFGECGINKIVTIEASGIGIACLTAQYFNVPVVFAKKSKTSNLPSDVFSAKVYSYTHGVTSDIYISSQYLSAGDKILIIDDFLANGAAVSALADIISSAGAELAGVGIVIEKGFQSGGELCRSHGIRVESLARIKSMSVEDGIVFF